MPKWIRTSVSSEERVPTTWTALFNCNPGQNVWEALPSGQNSWNIRIFPPSPPPPLPPPSPSSPSPIPPPPRLAIKVKASWYSFVTSPEKISKWRQWKLLRVRMAIVIPMKVETQLLSLPTTRRILLPVALSVTSSRSLISTRPHWLPSRWVCTLLSIQFLS